MRFFDGHLRINPDVQVQVGVGSVTSGSYFVAVANVREGAVYDIAYLLGAYG